MSKNRVYFKNSAMNSSGNEKAASQEKNNKPKDSIQLLNILQKSVQSATPEDILTLQRSIGNSAVAQMLKDGMNNTAQVQAKTDSQKPIQMGKLDIKKWLEEKAVEEGNEHPFTEAFVGKKSKEVEALSKWNPNAEGRNQGLVHIIDYAKARPAVDKELEKSTGGHAKSGQGFIELLSGYPQDTKKGEAEFYKKVDSGVLVEQKDGKGQYAGLSKEEKLRVDQIDTQIHEIEVQSLEKAGVIATKGRALGEMSDKNSGAAKTLKTEMGALRTDKKRLDDQIAVLKRSKQKILKYTVARDESKKGRVETVEKAAGATPGSFKGDEIIKVTDALDTLTASKGAIKTSTLPSNSQKVLNNVWEKKPEKVSETPVEAIEAPDEGRGMQEPVEEMPKVEKSPGWELKPEKTITDVSVSTDIKTPGEQPLRVVKWGPDEDSQKYSTVMGA